MSDVRDTKDVTVVVDAVVVGNTAANRRVVGARANNVARRRRCCCCALATVSVLILVAIVSILATGLHTYHQASHRFAPENNLFDGANGHVDFSRKSSEVGFNTEFAEPAPTSPNGLSLTAGTCDVSIEGRPLASISLDAQFDVVQVAGSSGGSAGQSLSTSIHDVDGSTAVWLTAQSFQAKFSGESLMLNAAVSCDLQGHVAVLGGAFNVGFSTGYDTSMDLDLQSVHSLMSNAIATLLDPDGPSRANSGCFASLTFGFPSVSYDVGGTDVTHQFVTSGGTLDCDPEACSLSIDADAAFSFNEVEGVKPHAHNLLAPLSFNADGDFGLYAHSSSDSALAQLMGTDHAVTVFNSDSFYTPDRAPTMALDRRSLGNPNAVPYDMCDEIALCYNLNIDVTVDVDACFRVATDLSHVGLSVTATIASTLGLDIQALWEQVSSDGEEGVADVTIDVTNFATQVFSAVGDAVYEHDRTAVDLALDYTVFSSEGDASGSVRAAYDVEPATKEYEVAFELSNDEGNVSATSSGTFLTNDVSLPVVGDVTVRGVRGNFSLALDGAQALVIAPMDVLPLNPALGSGLPTLVNVDVFVNASVMGDDGPDEGSRQLLDLGLGEGDGSDGGDGGEGDEGPQSGHIVIFAAAEQEVFDMHVSVVVMDRVGFLVRKVPDPRAGAADDSKIMDVVVVADEQAHIPRELFSPQDGFLVDYDGLHSFAVQQLSHCPNCTFIDDGEGDGDDYGSSDGEDEDDEGAVFGGRGTLPAYLAIGLASVALPIADTVVNGHVATSTHARSFLFLGNGAVNATSDLTSATNDWLNAEFHALSEAPIATPEPASALDWGGANLEAHAISTDVSGVGTVDVSVLGFIDEDVRRAHASGIRSVVSLQGDLTDATYAANAAYVDIVGNLFIIRNVTTDEATFKSPDWEAPPMPHINDSEGDGAGSAILAAVNTLPAEIAGLVAMIGKGLPDGECVSQSQFLLVDTTHKGQAVASAGLMHYAAASGAEPFVRLNAVMNSTDLLQPPDAPQFRTDLGINLTSVAAAARDVDLCSDLVTLGANAHVLFPRLTEQPANLTARLHAAHCKQLPSLPSGEDALKFLEVRVDFGGEPVPFNLNAQVDWDIHSQDIAATSAGEPLSSSFVASVDAGFPQPLALVNVSSHVTAGAGHNAGGFRSDHKVRVNVMPAGVDAFVDVETLNAFIDTELITLNVPQVSNNFTDIAAVAFSIDLACGPLCPCSPNCSTAQLLTPPPNGEWSQYGRHGFHSIAAANVTLWPLDGLNLVLDLPVDWTSPAPNGEGAALSELVVGGAAPAIFVHGQPAAFAHWVTTIRGENGTAAPAPTMSITGPERFVLQSDVNVTAGPMGLGRFLANLNLDKVFDPIHGGAGKNTFLSGLAVEIGNHTKGNVSGAHRFWPTGGGFKSTHDIQHEQGAEHIELDLLTGPDFARFDVQDSIGGQLRLGHPVGFVLAHVVDFAMNTTDMLWGVDFFYRDFVGAMEPFNRWDQTDIAFVARASPEAELSLRHLFKLPNEIDDKGFFFVNFTNSFDDLTMIVLDINAVEWSDATFVAAADLNVTATMISSVGSGEADFGLVFRHTLQGSGWNERREKNLAWAITIDTEGLADLSVEGNGHASVVDLHEFLDGNLTFSAVIATPTLVGIGTNVYDLLVDGSTNMSHYSGVSLSEIAASLDQRMPFGPPSNIFETDLNVKACFLDEADACADDGGDDDHDSVCDVNDSCPNDQENDADSDSVCGDIDECPHDPDDDLDNDGLCGDVDACPLDAENDADSDNVCGNFDSCPYSADGDTDGDGLCGDVDDCPLDAENDADHDGKCAESDSCPYDYFDDFDSDFLCDSDDPCPYEAHVVVCTIVGCGAVGGDADSDGVCGNSDLCPDDAANDADGDNVCETDDTCPSDGDNDADSDNICGNIDSCANDAENDADGDGRCGDVERCPYDAENDADNDDLCGDVDACPYDDENDADSDSICGDVDTCPYDAENDPDMDGLCSSVDSCPENPFNDPDGDGECGIDTTTTTTTEGGLGSIGAASETTASMLAVILSVAVLVFGN